MQVKLFQFVSKSLCYFDYNPGEVQVCRHSFLLWHKQLLLCLSPTIPPCPWLLCTGLPPVSAQVSFLINELCRGTKSGQVGTSIFNSKLLPKSTVLQQHCSCYNYQEKFEPGFEQRGRGKSRDEQGMAQTPQLGHNSTN